MSSWVALNVNYSGEFSVPDLPFSKITAMENPSDDFDLLLYVFTSRTEEAKEELLGKAIWCGIPAGKIIQVYGNDTSDMFSFESINIDGDVIQSWGSSPPDPFGSDEEYQPVLDRIEEEIGLRPSYGGNYFDLEE